MSGWDRELVVFFVVLFVVFVVGAAVLIFVN